MPYCYPYALLLFFLFFHSSASILPFNNTSQIKCIERERQALLNFKHGLIDHYGMLSTWKDDENRRDCCKWKGIQCDHQTGHVIILSLPGQDVRYLSGKVNITSLFVLQNIQYLDLSNNVFQGNEIPQLMASLANLRYLNLSDSGFGGSIPTQFGSLTHLRYLDLSYNYLDGELPYQFANLSQLRYLDLLGGNSFSGALPFQVGNLPFLHTLRLAHNSNFKPKDTEWLQMINLPKLRELRLVDCSLSDTDIQSLFYSYSNFSTSLTILDLSSNRLTSSTFQLLSNFSLNLQELYLSHNNIVLSSPVQSNFPSLVTLDLSYNNMTSLVFQDSFNFSSKLQNLHLQNCSLRDDNFPMLAISMTNSSFSLVSLDLSFNMLKSSSIFYWLSKFTINLRTLYLYDNVLEGPIPEEFGNVMNSLEVFYLFSNKLQGKIPSFFGNMCTLQSLHLSNNKLSGEISSFFQNSSWCNRHVFRSLDLSDNQITGMVPVSIRLLSELEALYLDGNHLEGDVTKSHLSNFFKLRYLYLSDNSLSLKIVPNWVPPFQIIYLGLGSCKLGPTFPNWLQTQSSLLELDISNNGLNGSVPEWFWNNLQNMVMLNMSQNNLTGAIPNISVKLLNRPYITLSSNHFEGKIPSFLLQASELRLSNNKFSDLFSFICDQSNSPMAILHLSNNELKGHIPDCWKSVDLLMFLDLSNNKLSGKIPVSIGSLVELKVLVLRNNNLTGELASTLKKCSNLIMLDVGENVLSGPIPSWIGESMQQLIILIMRKNHFSGNLPIQLCYLKHIQFMDLSRNMLSKGIPSCLKNWTAMSERSINRSDTRNRIYRKDIIYDYSLNISLIWKGVEQGFENPELKLKSIDLSNNRLMGEIPKEIGYLVGLISLNLSRNNMRGEIPSGIGNLRSLDFLDLSRNSLTGKIPSSLSQIDGLGKLDLSYNCLSGRIPSGRHFETFDDSSFEGNNDLCGEQVNRSCPGDGDGDRDRDERREVGEGEAMNGNAESDWYEALYMSMGIGYFTGFWGLLGPILLSRSSRNAYLSFLNRFTDRIYEQCGKCC